MLADFLNFLLVAFPFFIGSLLVRASFFPSPILPPVSFLSPVSTNLRLPVFGMIDFIDRTAVSFTIFHKCHSFLVGIHHRTGLIGFIFETVSSYDGFLKSMVLVFSMHSLTLLFMRFPESFDRSPFSGSLLFPHRFPVAWLHGRNARWGNHPSSHIHHGAEVPHP